MGWFNELVNALVLRFNSEAVWTVDLIPPRPRPFLLDSPHLTSRIALKQKAA